MGLDKRLSQLDCPLTTNKTAMGLGKKLSQLMDCPLTTNKTAMGQKVITIYGLSSPTVVSSRS